MTLDTLVALILTIFGCGVSHGRLIARLTQLEKADKQHEHTLAKVEDKLDRVLLAHVLRPPG